VSRQVVELDDMSDEADQLDLLIRSTTTLLNLLKPQLVESSTYRASSKKTLRDLNYLALLFVTREKGDVAAVTAEIQKEGRVIIWVTSEADDGKTNCAVSKDSGNGSM